MSVFKKKVLYPSIDYLSHIYVLNEKTYEKFACDDSCGILHDDLYYSKLFYLSDAFEVLTLNLNRWRKKENILISNHKLPVLKKVLLKKIRN